ncbi:Hermansky-Pudlak syndrome 1 protein isoform X1 [Alosa alosa]|uniref:Hermansky-Pudlak syndrome 1 protein isoform X1 n=2 Tax=Alosa alosa TaxID=278164 RepID=UPI002015134F|nr:Hermansky-Pudlak syndrome 1 protein isoform X1 [Alosa alosa]
MKCLLVASESAEVLFYWTDNEFLLRVQEQYGTARDEDGRPPAFEDRINTLFAPIIISCSTLVDRLGDSYTAFSTENNDTYVLHQFEECLYIAVNGDGEESEDDLKRKIYVMKKFTDVLFGMVTLSSALFRKELRPQDTEQRRVLWLHLQGLLETYSRLREQDQSFLVEAVERLISTPIARAVYRVSEPPGKQLNSSSERAGEEVQHAFILVHTKLLAFYSSRNASTLSASDLLTLMVMVQHSHPSNPEIDESSPEHVQHDTTVGSELFYTPEPSPTDNQAELSRASIEGSPMSRASVEGSPMFQFVDPDIQMAEDSLQTLQMSPPDPATPTRVFLETTLKEGFYPMMPHSMYTLPLWPGITLVLLTKIPSSHMAMSIYHFLETVTKLEKRLSDSKEGLVPLRGHAPIQELRSKMDKFIRVLGSSEIQTSLLQNAWVEFKNRAFNRGGPGLSRELVSSCKKLRTQLCGVFRQCFLSEGCRTQRLSPSLQDRALTMVQDKLMDWKEFLLVKSKRNITMVSYLEEFPGLIHFIYVDRAMGQMIAPSLNMSERASSELGKGPLAHYIKSKVWSLVGTARRYLQKGYTTVTQRDGDYYFCYFLWFENETGYKLEVVDIPSLPDDSAPIGMLAWDYYRKLLRYYSKTHSSEVVKCYELLTVHLGVIPSDYVLQHCSQLARKLWEPSRIPLL